MISEVQTTMDIKKTKETAPSTLKLKKAQEFVADVKSEIHKITWTNQEELIFYTKIVVFSTLSFGLGIYALDLTIQAVLNGLSYFMGLISG